MDTFDKLDRVDLQILRTLQENARLTTKELAARVSLSSTPVFERLKRLESGGYIKKYIAVLDAEKLNQVVEFLLDKESMTGEQFEAIMEGRKVEEASSTAMFDAFQEPKETEE